VQGFGSYWFKSLASIDFILVERFDYSFKYHKKIEGCLGEAMPRPVYYCRFFLLQSKET